MSAISINGLHKQFGWILSRRKVKALDGLDMEVPENSIYGFLGPNGAGKTTTIKIILGLIKADKGSSRIFNTDSKNRDVRERVGFLPDSPHFYTHLTAMEFLHFCGKLIHLPRMERAKRAAALLERVDLVDQTDQKLEGFSRGQLQRIGIAQALMSNPDLVILDEPITGLDPMGRRDVKNILNDLRDEGKTIFFSSHVLSDVEKMCDNIGIVNHGRLLTSGAINDLLGETGVEVWAAEVTPEVYSKTEALCSATVMKDNHTGFTLKDAARKDELVSIVEESGGRVQDIVSKREELEAFFLRRVQEDEDQRKGVEV
ncbi:MAG: ABC transporter ATP-binding protein [Planctomycetota bacterium]|jgi:ABC-2 type transport system ATP-binding protein